jgi:hypothetical protein
LSDHYHIHQYRTGGKADFERRTPDRIIIHRLLKYITVFRRQLTLIGISIIIISIVGFTVPFLIKIAIDEHKPVV